MPKTPEGWDFVISRVELNFGEFLNAIPQDSPILDVPCGVGYLEYYLLKKGFTKIHAVDLSEEQIQVAKSKLREYGHEFDGKVEFHVADAFEYLKKGHSYAAIAMIDFLEHLEKDKILEILGLSYDALQPGGFLFLRVTSADNPMWGRFFYRDFTHVTPFTPDSLHQCLRATGFEVIKVDYEVLPRICGSWIIKLKQSIRYRGLWFLGKFLGIPPQAFTEDLIAVAKR